MKLRLGMPEEVGISSDSIKRISRMAQGWVESDLTQALVLVVARRGVVVLDEAYGRLAPGDDAPPIPKDALFTLCSLSKPITATAVMILVQEGLVGLNRPVFEYIPEFRGEGKQAILVSHLLTHTSGLTEAVINAQIDERLLANVPVPAASAIQDPRVNQLLHYGYDAPLSTPTGVVMSYCSYHFDLLGEIVQRVSGQSLQEFARERIFGPLGMEDSWYVLPEELRHRVVHRAPTAPLNGPLSPGWDGMSVYPLRGPGLAWFDGIDCREWEVLASGAGGVFSTALDIAKFGQMFLNRGEYGSSRILSAATVAAMIRNQIRGIGVTINNVFYPEASRGLGWGIWGTRTMPYNASLCSPNTFEAGGAGGVKLWVDPDNEIVGVYFSVANRNNAMGDDERVDDDLFMNAITASIMDS